MKSQLIATSLLLATLATPLAAMADPAGCGKPQGYGTTNPHIPNSSNCGEIRSYSGVVMSHNFTAGTRPRGYGTTNPYVPNTSNCEPVQSYAGPMSPNNYTDSTRPAGYGTTNPYPFNAGTTNGPKVYSDSVGVGDWSSAKPAGYGTKNPYIFNSGRLRPGETPL